jgi:LmbE family N-acetylglucosaminyl deacetylase
MPDMSSTPRTLVFVHAHPDDESLLTAGTMARASAEGNRVVLVVATDGAAGLASSQFQDDLGATRAAELKTSADALGVARTFSLGFPDSGLHGEVANGFANASRFAIASSLAEICNEERADVVVGYDPSGGYGHPDHIQVHRSVRAASVLCNRPPRVFEATLPREPIARAVRLAAAAHLTPADFSPEEFARTWTPAAQITHRVNVRPYLSAKRASLSAHASQASADGTTRTLAILTGLPVPVQHLLLGTEYYCLVSEPHRASTSVASVGLS